MFCQISKNNFELEIPTDLLVIRNDRETKNYLQKEYKNGLYIKHNKKNRSNISNCSIRRCDEHSLTGMYVLFKHNCKETLNSTPSTSNLSTPNPSTEIPSTLNSNSSTETPSTQNSNPSTQTIPTENSNSSTQTPPTQNSNP
jgi:hypothetical protein